MKRLRSTNRCWCAPKRTRQRASAMRNAAKILIADLACRASPACNKPQRRPQNQDMTIDEQCRDGGLPANADIETLPPDESSATPSNELANGYDNPDVNDLGNSQLRRSADEALLFARRLLARLRTSCFTRSASTMTPRASTSRPRRSRTAATIYDQPQGRGAGARARQRRSADRERGDPAISRRPRELAGSASAARRFPPLPRARMVNFITTELHKRFAPLFKPEASDETKQLRQRPASRKKLDYDRRAARRRARSCSATTLTLPDPYLFVITGWADKMLGGSTAGRTSRHSASGCWSGLRSATCCGSKDC